MQRFQHTNFQTASKRMAGTDPQTIPTTSRVNNPLNPGQLTMKELNNPPRSSAQKFRNYIYNGEKGTFCNRSCSSWAQIFAYFIMYLVFLGAYTLIFLYGSLAYIKSLATSDSSSFDSIYTVDNIGLSATPTSERGFQLIWYRQGVADDYRRYVDSIEKLLVGHRMKRDVGNDLGPCGQSPYGYGESPCIIVRINKNLRWTAQPLKLNSSLENVPEVVRNWIKSDEKYWLHCSGYHSYDKEHVGTIRYYPNPPGFDPKLFPMDMKKKSPLVAIQLSNFTLGISLDIECQLWYDEGVSSIAFVLYVMPKGKTSMRANHSHSHSQY